jgi:hypothetical protein
VEAEPTLVASEYEFSAKSRPRQIARGIGRALLRGRVTQLCDQHHNNIVPGNNLLREGLFIKIILSKEPGTISVDAIELQAEILLVTNWHSNRRAADFLLPAAQLLLSPCSETVLGYGDCRCKLY